MNRAWPLMVVVLMSLMTSVQAEEEREAMKLDLDTISIQGNPEMPRIVYLTGWRKPLKGDILQQTLQSRHSSDITTIDRDVLRRQAMYYQKLEQLRD